MIVVLGCSFKVAWLGGETLFVYKGSIERWCAEFVSQAICKCKECMELVIECSMLIIRESFSDTYCLG